VHSLANLSRPGLCCTLMRGNISKSMDQSSHQLTMKLLLLSVCLMLNQSCLRLGFCEETGDRLVGKECVILLHGLGRTKYSMTKIERRLKEEGYLVVNCDYPSTKKTIEELSRIHVSEAVKCCRNQSAKKIHFVTHSLGGILVRQYLQKNSIPDGGRVIMLSPPNKGSVIADRLKNNFLYKWITGPAGQQLGTGNKSVPNRLNPIEVEVGVITGNRSLEPWFSSMIPGDDDGKVSVKRAGLKEMNDFLVVESSHTFIMQNSEVIDQIVIYLKNGRFNPRRLETSQ